VRSQVQKSRSALVQRLVTAFCFYAIPLGATILYALRLLPPDRAKELLTYALLLGGISAAVFILWVRHLQPAPKIPTPVSPPSNAQQQKTQPQRDELVATLQQQLLHLRTQLDQVQTESQHQLLQKQAELDDLSKSMLDQRQLIQKKQLRIGKLEAKVRDLDYEVKTLLQLDDLRAEGEQLLTPAHPPIQTSWDGEAKNSSEAAVHLHRLVSAAQRLPGMAHLAGQLPRYLDTGGETSALDLRRLFDQLQDDANMVLVYSRREGQLLFANGQVRHQLGWHPDRFTKEFFQIIQHGTPEWHRAVTQLDTQAEARIKLALKHRDNHDLYIQAVLSRIPSGPFEGLVLALLYKAG
jgi:PAS domain-containing protein